MNIIKNLLGYTLYFILILASTYISIIYLAAYNSERLKWLVSTFIMMVFDNILLEIFSEIMSLILFATRKNKNIAM